MNTNYNNDDVFYSEEELEINYKWNIEKHSKQVRKNHPDYVVYTSIMINLLSMYYIYLDFNIKPILLTSVIMFFFIDLASGVLHIILDNPYNLSSSFISEYAEGFQQHHYNTALIVNMRLADHLRPMAIVIVLTSYIGLLIHGSNNTSLYIFIVIFSFNLCWMQCCHRWSHMSSSKRGRTIIFLQKVGLCLKPIEHLKHHKAPYLSNFCIMSGTFNPILNRITKNISFLHPHRKIWTPIFVGLMAISIYTIPKL